MNLDDPRALLARARKHFAELNALLHPQDGPRLWQTRERRDPQTGEWFYCLHLDRQRLIEAKPIIADSATNIASALDHVAAAIAKANGHDRLKTLYFPWGLTDEDFDKKLRKVEDVLGAEMSGVLAAARTRHRHEVHHVEAAKQISNSGKHWELMASDGTAHGIALNVPGRQRIFQIPADAFAEADAFEFHRGAVRLPSVPISIVIGQAIDGLDEGLPRSPDSILECSFRFVEGVIAAVAEAAA
ncbi:hypothetical protein OLX02_18970 [Novosphingobium sp. KCTC 2891]|uniref:hypothetical protein n=1 Tax=Novosphingobium sp. KCTC 2891 TaxID=2989730 RepID=UPI002221E2F4|nr:hypothetical protein [Novosphingobium sp. KCTC 2891]MCW1384902.1 hypothetical protein [Novosphingobium sp. KCTC 2891]